MTIYDVRVGGGKAGTTGGAVALPRPKTAAGMCCEGKYPERTNWGAQYFRSIDFCAGRDAELCSENLQDFVAGDGLLISEIYAGTPIDTIIYNNKVGLAGFTFHYELHDLYGLLSNAVSTAELAGAVIDGSAPIHGLVDVRALNGGAAYMGSLYGSYFTAGTPPVDQNCLQHKALVLVVDTMPTPNTPPVLPVGCENCADCKGCSSTCCPLNFKVVTHVPTFVPEGLNIV